MKKTVMMLVAGLMVAAGSVQGQVVISQYYEGSSGSNRLLEIWNHSASAINFATTNLILEQFNNGSSTVTYTLNISSGILAAGDVFVIANTDATGDTALSTAGLLVDLDTTSQAMDFNGDDTLRLTLGSTIVDILGQIGTDPGTSWSGSGVSTANQNIQLINNSYTVGDTNGTNTFDPSARFTLVTSANVTSGSFTGFGFAPVPEPSTYALIGLGLGALWFFRRRQAVVVRS